MEKINNLSVTIYSRLGTSPISTLYYGQDTIYNISFGKMWPGGIYGTCALEINKSLMDTLFYLGANRVVVRNNCAVVYEGYITDKGRAVSGNSQRITITCAGAWGEVISRLSTSRLWASRNLSMLHQKGGSFAQKDDFTWGADADGVLNISPTVGHAFGSTYYLELRIDARYSQAIERLSYSVITNYGAGTWATVIRRSNDGITWTAMTDVSGETYNSGTTTSITTTTSATIDVELATPSRYVEVYFASGANQTVAVGTAIDAKYSDFTVYGTTDAVTMYKVLYDCIDDLSTDGVLNADITQIEAADTGSDIAEMVASPFREYWAPILLRAASHGDSSNNSYAVYTLDSEYSSNPDGTPVLCCRQYPSLDDYEYVVSSQYSNVGPMEIYEDYSLVRTSVHVVYTDPATGLPAEVESTYAGAYGERDEIVNTGLMNAADAQLYADRMQAAYSVPRWRVDQPVTIYGYINTKSGSKLPASQIMPGNRVMFADYPPDPTQAQTAGYLIMIITRVEYNDATQVAQITLGDIRQQISAPISYVSVSGPTPTPRPPMMDYPTIF